jgi:hypothetical protein
MVTQSEAMTISSSRRKSVSDSTSFAIRMAVGLLADLAEQFEHDYRAAIRACIRPGLPLTACTI